MSVDTLSFFPKTAEAIELTYTIGLYKHVRWEERELSQESYRPVATSPTSSLKFTFGRSGVFLQIASHIVITVFETCRRQISILDTKYYGRPFEKLRV